MKKRPWVISGFLSKKKIRTQLYSVYVAAVFIPISIVGIYLLVYMSQYKQRVFVFVRFFQSLQHSFIRKPRMFCLMRRLSVS